MTGCHRSWQCWSAALELAGTQHVRRHGGLAPAPGEAGRGPGPGSAAKAAALRLGGQTGDKRGVTSWFVGLFFFPLARFSQKLVGILSVCQSSCDFFISLSLVWLFLNDFAEFV